MARYVCSVVFVLVLCSWSAACAEEATYLYCSFKRQEEPFVDLKVKTEGVNQFAERVTVTFKEDDVPAEKTILQLKSAGAAFLVFVISPEDPKSSLRFYVYNDVIDENQGIAIWKASISPFGAEEDPYGRFQEFATGGCYID